MHVDSSRMAPVDKMWMALEQPARSGVPGKSVQIPSRFSTCTCRFKKTPENRMNTRKEELCHLSTGIHHYHHLYIEEY